jgi:hypothetical protein
MSHTRPSARTLTGVLLAAIVFSLLVVPAGFAADTSAPPTALLVDSTVTCGTNVTAADGSSKFTAGFAPTKWPDDLHPPTTIRVLRSDGPNKGHVETVNFFWYVGVVMRAEYSSGATKTPLWMRMGSLSVKQYGWYKAMQWGGGRVTFTVANPDGSTTSKTECYDVKDTTADQLYKPERLDTTTGQWVPKNVPNSAINTAMRETWHMSLRKWQTQNNRTKMFLTGYRSGYQNPCGTDSTGYKIFQKSLYDCTVKNLTTYETIRRYYEPSFVVDTRDHDFVADDGWRGDLGVLNQDGSNVRWNLYDLAAATRANDKGGTFSNLSLTSLVGWGAGNVNAARSAYLKSDGSPDVDPKDAGLLADMIMVTKDNNVLVAKGTGSGLAVPARAGSFAGAPADKAVFGDFDGDLLTDVGLVRYGSGTTLQVMLARGDGTFTAPADWSGPLALPTGAFVAAGDVNGDGKLDLIVRDSSGSLSTAISPPSCTSYASWGPCPSLSTGVHGVGGLSAASAGTPNGSVLVGDYDRDGRSDLLVVAGDGKSVAGMRGKTDGTFTDPQTLWQGSTAMSGQAVALNVNPDGMTDIAFVGAGSISWLRTNERTTVAASMTSMGSIKASAAAAKGGF